MSNFNLINVKQYENIFPEEIAEKIYNKFINETDWNKIDQVREKH